jgi:ribulose-5-phosphate 4-epimerase/fuculose-1-phosphate aldolase
MSVTQIAKKNQSVREQVSKEEWETRVNLAACYRLMHEFGMTEMIANHISARVPGTHDQFLINPYGMLYEEMTASSMIKIDIDGNILFNATEYGINKAGYVIHSAVHAARHDVDCVIHTHTLAGMAVSAMKTGLLPLAQTAMRFGDVAYHDYEGPALNLDERARLVADLGDREAMILRNHGLLTVGPSIAESFNNMFRLERACQLQVTTLSCNAQISLPPAEVVKETQDGFKPGVRRRWGLIEWPALMRKLDKIDPSYRD